MDSSLRIQRLFRRQALNSAAVPFLAGMLLWAGLESMPLLFCLLFFALLFLILSGLKRNLLLFFAFVGVFLAFLLSLQLHSSAQSARRHSGASAEVQGIVTDTEDVQEEGKSFFDLSSSRIDGRKEKFKIRIYSDSLPKMGERFSGVIRLSRGESTLRGEGVFLTGTVTEGGFSGHDLFYSALGSLRSLSGAALNEIPHPEFAKAILLGDRTALSDDLKEAFRASGTSHLLAISGLHISMILSIAGAVIALFVPRKRGRVLLLALFALFYASLSGFSPSVVRAALLCCFSQFGILIRRKSHSVTSLFASACVILLFRPANVWSISFWLSFFACLGILTVGSPLLRALERKNARMLYSHESRKVRSFLSVLTRPLLLILSSVIISLSCSLFLLPCQILYFREVGLLLPLNNLLLLPLFSVILFFAALSFLFSLIKFMPIAHLFGRCYALFLSPFLWLQNALASANAPTIHLSGEALYVGAAAISICLALLFFLRPKTTRVFALLPLCYGFLYLLSLS